MDELTDWNGYRALLATVEAGSLSAAARRLGLTQPTLGRQVAALEASLQLVAPLRDMGEAAERLAMVAAGQSQSVEGVVRITAADIYAAYVLPPILARLRAEAPGISIEVMAVNSISDLIRREADIAIRHVRPEQDGLVARRCADTTAHIYASPAYLDRVGRPQVPGDLEKLEFAGSADSNEGFSAEMRKRGVTLGPANFQLATQSGVAAWEWVRAGICLSPMVDSVAVATGGVEVVLPQLEPIAVPVWLVTHRELHTSRRIRMVFDLLAESFGGR
jgi:DNA-binding transcriptional LysR family regulator